MSIASLAYRRFVSQGINQLLSPLGLSIYRTKNAVEFGYPPSHASEPRWERLPDGHQPELKRLIEAQTQTYVGWFDRILARAEEMRSIPRDPNLAVPASPAWLNHWFPSLDAAALHTILSELSPSRYLEVGSGHSTKFARFAVDLHGRKTRITSIDPQPRAEVDALCDEVIRQPVEAVSLEQFESLRAGDVLFMDSSHRSFMNSDVTILFLDILPRLRKGVIVHLHDIYLPSDYPRSNGTSHLYNEQYLLAAYLLGGGRNVEILLPNYWLTTSPSFEHYRAELWKRLGFQPDFPANHRGGGSFWMRISRDPD
jgi:hypothetical protein